MTRRHERGYAMLLVLLVLLLLSLTVGTLAWHLTANIAETRRIITTIRTDSACASALDLAGRTITKAFADDPGTDPDTLIKLLCDHGGCDTSPDGVSLPKVLAPAGTTLQNFAIAFSSPTRATTRRVPDGPFLDRYAVERSMIVVVSLKDELTGRVCSSNDRYIIPSLPMASFALFGTAPTTTWAPTTSMRRSNDGPTSATCAPPTDVSTCGSRIHVNGNVGGLTTTDFVSPPLQFSTDQPHIHLPSSTDGSDAVLRPPVSAAMASAQNGLEHSFRWLVDAPDDGDSANLRRARLAGIADIVIVDGVWYYHRDKSQPWPGKPIYSDHAPTMSIPDPAGDVVESADKVGMADLDWNANEFPRLYSWYDRDSATTSVRAQLANGGGVLSYGPLAVKQLTTDTCTSDADCATGAECFREDTSSGNCIRIEPGLWPAPNVNCVNPADNELEGISDCASGTETVSLVDGTRSGFEDDGKRILPINIHLGKLAEALRSTTVNELGHVTGAATDPTRFNGVIYITSRFTGGSLPSQNGQDGGSGPRPLCEKTTGSGTVFGSCPPSADASVHDPLAQFVVPVGLCGDGVDIASNGGAVFGPQSCSTASRPNAVRVYGGANIPADVFLKGLTVATDLPLYVYGDINRVQVVAGVTQPQVKVSLVGDRITFMSRGWRDAQRPWNRDVAGTLPATGVQVIEASIVTGVPLRNGDTHQVGDAFRTLQTWNNNHFIIRGHIALAWNSEWMTDTDTNRTVKSGLRWLPDFHLENPGFQPPGLPTLSLPPSGRWRQR